VPRFEATSIEHEHGRWVVRGSGGLAVATRAVVSAIPPRTALLELLQPADLLPTPVAERLRRATVLVGNVSQLTLAAVLDGMPTNAIDPEYLASTLWLLPDPATHAHAYEAARDRRLPDRIGTLLTFPSLMDPSLASGGLHTMWANSFVAADLAGGWEAVRDACADVVWRTIEHCLPGSRHRALGEVLTTPADLERYTGAANPGNHVAPIPEQMLRDRPARGLGWRTPIPGFYLTGAGTHPGGGVSGVSGRATARAVIADLQSNVVGRAWNSSRAIAGQLAKGVTAWRQARAIG
jgi:phytoene dehydrogenase-like protein